MKRICVLIAIMLFGVPCDAKEEKPKLMPLPPIAPGLQLSRLFNDHMVLQRDTQVKVWGWAASGEKVAVEFAGQTKSATAAGDGSWQVVLDPMSASATGRTLTVRSAASSQKVEINDVLVGEVWLLGGQSNIAFPFGIRPDGFDKAQIEANPQYRDIRCLTIDRWHGEGLPRELCFSQVFDIARYFGLDPYQQFWFSTTDATIEATQHHVEGMVSNMDDYLRIRPQLFPDHASAIRGMSSWAARQERDEVVVWATLEGFFWFPRTLMGFETMMYAYADEPELLHQINQDLLEFNLRLLDRILPICVPTFMTIAEDMSYNHGPMISKRTFEEFVAPYYRQLLPRLQEHQIPLIVDTDGDVTLLVPWLKELGIAGVLPLERQAGVDGLKLRQQFPDFLFIGHFDKMTMNRGEQAMRAEFERLRPMMRAGGFIPSVDHQTPPGVSLDQYRSYLRLLDEYTAMTG